MKKSQKASLNKALLKKKVIEDQVVVLNKSLEEAKAVRDKAIVASDSLKFEQERLSQVAKEESEEKLKALSERDITVKALEDERNDRKAMKERIKKEAYELARTDVVTKILNYGMGFRCSILFMIKEKYPDLDLSNVDLTEMRGYEKPDLVDGSNQQRDQGAEEGVAIVVDQAGEKRTKKRKILRMYISIPSLLFLNLIYLLS